MVRITVELVRKRAEHHDKQLAPLEEIALHQENIEKIEYLQDWCPKLKILLLQSNLIAKIENINKLKYLNYLNLALNNIEKIENLDRCESLNKLDLTLNFVGNLTDVESLRDNYNLENLYLMGNPCTDYEGYRNYVIATLPQLESLDGKDIDRSERIKALQNLKDIKVEIIYDQEEYTTRRSIQKTRLLKEIEEKRKNIDWSEEDDERDKHFWKEKCEHAPEVRLEMEQQRQLKANKYQKSEVKKVNQRPLFNTEGRPYNINQPKVTFKFDDGDPFKYVLDIAVYKYLDTSLIDVDIQPRYVRVTLKGKIFQLCLPSDVNVSKSETQRSQTTGHLLITMPKPSDVLEHFKSPRENNEENKNKNILNAAKKDIESNESKTCIYIDGQTKREYLEIGPERNYVLDFTKMTQPEKRLNCTQAMKYKPPSEGFVDNPEVPELI